jgi:hypothetical protein
MPSFTVRKTVVKTEMRFLTVSEFKEAFPGVELPKDVIRVPSPEHPGKILQGFLVDPRTLPPSWA